MRSRDGLSWTEKAHLASRIWFLFAVVSVQVRRLPLPEFVAELTGAAGSRAQPRRPAATLSNAVSKSLRIGSHRPRCLISALVLYRLLRDQGDPAELVIGLPDAAPDQRAHAWVEVDGKDVGPPPGRGRHVELARLP